MFRQIALRSASALKSSSSRAFSTYKTSTGLVGLAVDANGRETLLALSDKVLTSVKRIPAESQYRIDVEQWFGFIKNSLQENTDIKKIEDALELGQIEEVIEAAKDELELIDFYYEQKGWERVAEAKAEADTVLASLADSIYFLDPQGKVNATQPSAPQA